VRVERRDAFEGPALPPCSFSDVPIHHHDADWLAARDLVMRYGWNASRTRSSIRGCGCT